MIEVVIFSQEVCKVTIIVKVRFGIYNYELDHHTRIHVSHQIELQHIFKTLFKTLLRTIFIEKNERIFGYKWGRSFIGVMTHARYYEPPKHLHCE